MGAFHQEQSSISTVGRGTVELTGFARTVVARAGVRDGLCHVFVHHTSTSLIVSENADAAVRRDLERFFARLAPDGDPLFEHDSEGPDDMPAHVRSVLTQTEVTIPVRGGQCDLGTWQGIYLWEHRLRGYERRITVTVWGN